MSDSIIIVDGEKYVKMDDIITITEIAILCGVTTPAVSNWRSRYKSFPAPFKLFGQKTALYLKSEVIVFFAEHIAGGYAPEIKQAIMDQLTADALEA